MKYREDKATQAAGYLLKLRGGRMSYMKLIKLLYLADRTALLRWGRPITFDSYCSLPRGPILSFTLDKIDSEPDPESPSYWHKFISEKNDYEVSLIGECPNDQLSPAEEAILKEIFHTFGCKSRWDIVKYCHGLPEWRDPEGSALSITIRNILQAEGFSDEDVREVEESLEAEASAEQAFG